MKGINHVTKPILTGISYLVPLLIASSFLLVVGELLGGVGGSSQSTGLLKHGELLPAQFIYQLGLLGKMLTLPIFTTAIAYSIGDRLALTSGLIVGLLNQQMQGGYLGAIVVGVLVGYICWVIHHYCKLPSFAASMIPVFVIPVLGTIVTAGIFYILLSAPIAWLTETCQIILNQTSWPSQMLLATLLGGMIGYDFGGPVNKCAIVISLWAFTMDSFFINTAVQVAIVIPPIGFGLATGFRKRKQGGSYLAKNAILMGLMGISEGALPLINGESKRKQLISMVVTGFAGMFTVLLKTSNRTPISGIYGWPLVTHPLVYTLVILSGSLLIMMMTLLFTSVDSLLEENGNFNDEEWESEWEE